MYLHSVMFELELIRSTENSSPTSSKGNSAAAGLKLDRKGSQGARSILLKGQMRYIEDIKAIVFLCSPLYVILKDISVNESNFSTSLSMNHQSLIDG